MSSWLFKRRDDKNPRGRVCNVVNIKGINYKDFIREFGKPNEVDKQDWGRGQKDIWQFETPNGEKFDIYFDTSDYVINKMRKEKLKSHGPVKIEDIDEFKIQGSIEQIAMLKMYLHFVFGIDELERFDRERTFEYLFERWNDR